MGSLNINTNAESNRDVINPCYLHINKQVEISLSASFKQSEPDNRRSSNSAGFVFM